MVKVNKRLDAECEKYIDQLLKVQTKEEGLDARIAFCDNVIRSATDYAYVVEYFDAHEEKAKAAQNHLIEVVGANGTAMNEAENIRREETGKQRH